MASDTLNEIVETCLALEGRAREIFVMIAASARTDEERQFWQELADASGLHREMVSKAESRASGFIPSIFFNPHEMKLEFEVIGAQLDELLAKYHSVPTVDTALLLAYRIHFSLLHPSFANIFLLAREVREDDSHETAYQEYLDRFVTGIRRLGLSSPERALLDEVLQRLWSEIRQLAGQTHTDALTGVLNRAGFFKAVSPLAYAAQRNASNLGIMLLDMDYFRLFNETFGHRKSDAMLKVVAEVIDSNVRRSDVVGRYDGDEFIVFLSPVEPDALLAIAETLRMKIESETGKRMVPVTVSVGVAQGVLANDVEQELEELIKKAAEGQMRAKYTGKNRVAVREDKKKR